MYLIWITLIPALELRASIPWGIAKYKMNFVSVFLICVITNIILGIVYYLLLDLIVKLICKIKFFERIYLKVLVRSQKKIQKYVDKYGEIGVAIFIGIPLPGSGVYTGALGSYAIGLKFKKFVIADIIGVIIAGIIVTVVTLCGGELIRKIFIKPAFILPY